MHEAAREVARSFAGTPEYLQSRRERKKVEMLFAHLKRVLRLNRLRLRGLASTVVVEIPRRRDLAPAIDPRHMSAAAGCAGRGIGAGRNEPGDGQFDASTAVIAARARALTA